MEQLTVSYSVMAEIHFKGIATENSDNVMQVTV